MAFSINDFKSDINTKGLSKSSYYDVFILPPVGLTNNPTNVQHLSFRCFAAELPGRQVVTFPNRVYGPIRKIAYNQAISDVTLSFLCSESLVEKVFFDPDRDWETSK